MGTEYPKDVESTLVHEERYEDVENEPLLSPKLSESSPVPTRKLRFTLVHIVISFLLGVLVQFTVSKLVSGSFNSSPNPQSSSASSHDGLDAEYVPSYVGSTTSDVYPPTRPINTDPHLFPSNIGYAGTTLTGAEPALLATAPVYPVHSGAPGLLTPVSLSAGKSKGGKKFDLFRYWGNVSPWFSNEPGAFGVESGPEVPGGCRVTGLHLLHRHGARYPTGSSSYGGPSKFATKVHDAGVNWSAEGDLSFLNDWTYKLGQEILTPFGRHQLFDLGVSMRMKYGFLLKNFTDSNILPVFRTESQDRMLASAMNFALGFFGYPLDGQYEQSITVESSGYNNTLAPYGTCPNANMHSKSDRGTWYVKKWAAKYLKSAQARLNAQLTGLELTIEDVYIMQQMCAYETVALGYSKFCELFTQAEWEGFEYSLDLYFWYGSAFGSPVARVQGIGYVQELVARLTKTPIQTYNTSMNSTLNDNPITFPLDGRSLYVDATHEVVVLNVITALNLTSLAKSGPLPVDKIPTSRSFVASRLAPFATNIQFQLLSCDSTPDPQIRVIINDGVAPLSSLKSCPEDSKYGMCSVNGFVDSMREIIGNTDWEWECYGDWEVPAGDKWTTVNGSAPARG